VTTFTGGSDLAHMRGFPQRGVVGVLSASSRRAETGLEEINDHVCEADVIRAQVCSAVFVQKVRLDREWVG
jgi:hypothetical protein